MFAHAPVAVREIAASTKESDMWGTLEYISELPFEQYRSFEYDGEKIRLHQVGSKCTGEMANTYEPYCRLSVELDEDPPAGWFWLKDWSENQKLVEFLIEQRIIERHPTDSRLTGYNLVVTAARINPYSLLAAIHGA